jgi:hypothetical protein
MSSDQKTVKPVMEHTTTTHSETSPIEFWPVGGYAMVMRGQNLALAG